MESLRELYKIGRGPSSSHTMGPEKASKLFLAQYDGADRYEAILYGSLAKTGKGHMTDLIIEQTFAPRKIDIIFNTENMKLPHANTMELIAYKGDKRTGFWRVMSVGGGEIEVEGHPGVKPPDVYKHKSFAAIKKYCTDHDMSLWEYVEHVEGKEIWDYLDEVWHTMKKSIDEGLHTSGILRGGLELKRKAKLLYNKRHIDESDMTREDRIVCAYAFAVSEQNASLGEIVTAPTCGSCGVLPAVMRYLQERRDFSEEDVLHALAAGGIVGNLIKHNASISGAECGCQAEIGTACSMAAAAAAELYGMDLDEIEYAAEVAMEHHLGLTCDPVRGLVQIPCIERNAVAAMRAINSVRLANFLTQSRKISLDMVIETMYNTGRDMSRRYRETSEGGLATSYIKKLKARRRSPYRRKKADASE